MVADKSKKLKVSEKGDNAEEIDGELVLSIEKLQEMQDELEKINEEASDKVLEIEQKYNEIRKPLYDQRNDLIKSIPDFWLTAGTLVIMEDTRQ
ncbi:NAP1-related protein 1-like [Vicia villosa]|uniref:NAP1-related protein 1-like n=1 Tax=Vicia villosa TaxID=3911 RepID=UPI00273B35FC|nr:NAP1-related protein 1-like [Vicia villosa]